MSKNSSIYTDIATRTNGDVYIGVVGPVRCGKSTFIQKFVENFTRRFAASISGDVTEYTLEFYDIIEMPPKVTVRVKAKTQEYMLSQGSKDSFDIVNELSGILELYR